MPEAEVEPPSTLRFICTNDFVNTKKHGTVTKTMACRPPQSEASTTKCDIRAEILRVQDLHVSLTSLCDCKIVKHKHIILVCECGSLSHKLHNTFSNHQTLTLKQFRLPNVLWLSSIPFTNFNSLSKYTYACHCKKDFTTNSNEILSQSQ